MTIEEAKNGIEILRSEGRSDEEILNIVYEMYQNNARLRQEISELRDTLYSAEVEEVSTEEIGLGTKFVATLNDLDGEVVTRKYTLFGGAFLALDQNTDFALVSVAF